MVSTDETEADAVRLPPEEVLSLLSRTIVIKRLSAKEVLSLLSRTIVIRTGEARPEEQKEPSLV